MENYYMGIDVSKGYADFVILDARKTSWSRIFSWMTLSAVIASSLKS